MSNNLVAGFDLGTSSLKLVVLNTSNNKIELEIRKSTRESNILNENKLFSEQNVSVILQLIKEIFTQLPRETLDRIKAWQFCGQVILSRFC